jgi:hypothetical protein
LTISASVALDDCFLVFFFFFLPIVQMISRV